MIKAKDVIFILCLVLIAWGAINGCSPNELSSLNMIQKQVANAKNAAKQKMIQAAAAAYLAEQGHSPASLDDLVAAGFLSPQDIVDQNGNQFAYAPEVPEQTTGTTVTIMTKSCGRCGKPVANTSKVGDRCPHCGVVWGYERKL